MKQFLIKFLVLCIGVASGIYVSSKVNFLDNVITDMSIKNDIKVEDETLTDKSDYADDLVLINSVYDGFVIDLKYATKNNITKTVLYDKELAYLQKNTLDKLIQVNEELRTKGYRLKIWDAYRPLFVQKKLWAAMPNSNYIANPFTTGSNHNRGAAVDVTLVDLNGVEVEMPTGFDEFGAKCRRGSKWSAEATKNVEILTETMLKYGFDAIDSEWWHFDDINAKKYSIMDYKFRDLIKK